MRQQLANPSSGAADRAVARLAAGQHGAVSVAQLRLAGLGPNAISRRVAAGRLHRVHRGVYAVGHPGLSREGVWMAAVLAGGPGAALSHRSAACLWKLLPSGPRSVELTVPGTGGRRRPGIRFHRKALTAVETTSHLGIPVTSPRRTLVDLTRVVAPRHHREAIRQAEIHGLSHDLSPSGVGLTRSELELRFLRLCRRHRLPPPEVNSRVGPFVADFLWPEQALVVETDGWRYHRGRQAFEEDRSRQLRLQLLGYRVARFTHRQLVEDPARVAAAVRTLLAAAIVE